MNTKLIVLEGIDGVGKTSLAKSLTDCLNEAGMPTIWYDRHPTRTSLLSPEDKRWLREEASVRASFYCFLASTLHKSREIEVLLRTHTVVVDRYLYSVFAHHYALGLPLSRMRFTESSLPRKPEHAIHVRASEPVRQANLRRRSNPTAEECQDADDLTTVIGKKRSAFQALMSEELWNENGFDAALDRLFSMVT